MRKGENFILGLFGEPVMIFNKNINQTYDKSGIKSGVKKIFQKNDKLSNKVDTVIVYIL